MNFADVADLLADVALDYSAVSEGDILTAGGHRYKVAGQSDTEISRTNLDGYHLQTAGGVKVRVLRGDAGYSVDAFGAIGDDSTPCASAFQKAIFAAGNAGGRIYVPAGKFRIGETLLTPPNSVGLHLCGDGLRATRLTWDGGSAKMIHVDCESGNFIDNFRITDLMFDSVGSATHAVYTSGVRLLMERVFANPYNKFSSAIIAAASNVTTYNITLRDCHLFSSRVGQAHDYAVDIPRGHTFNAYGCMFSGHKTAIRLGATTALAGANIDGCRFETFSDIVTGYPGSTTAVAIELQNVWSPKVTGCNFELASDGHSSSSGHRAIKVGPVRGLMIMGNTFQGQNIATNAIDVTTTDCGGISSVSNYYFRLVNGAAAATNPAKVTHYTNYTGV